MHLAGRWGLFWRYFGGRATQLTQPARGDLWVRVTRLTRFVHARVVGHLQHQQLAALEALADGVDAGDGRTLQPHRHQRLPQLLVAVVLEGDLAIRAARAGKGDRRCAE